jgi:peptidyl-prolyl cis-trans isomerase SurA
MRLRALPALLIAAAFWVAPGQSTAGVVEKVVAVVGERAILLSDVRERARPFLLRINQEVPAGAQRNAAISQTYKNVLERMVDEELQQRAANRAKIVVDAREVDEAIGRIATQNGLSVDQLVQEAIRSGLDEKQYRNEIRRQVLEAKMLNLRVQGRIKVSEEDLRTAYRRMVMDERKRLSFRAAWIRIDAGSGDRAAIKRARQRADAIAERARRGADFGELARLESDDPATRNRGGVLGQLNPGRLSPAIDNIIMGMEAGQISGAIRVADSFFVVKLIEREESELPDFSDARNQLAERVYLDKMGKARRVWLDALRKQTHVEVRL